MDDRWQHDMLWVTHVLCCNEDVIAKTVNCDTSRSSSALQYIHGIYWVLITAIYNPAYKLYILICVVKQVRWYFTKISIRQKHGKKTKDIAWKDRSSQTCSRNNLIQEKCTHTLKWDDLVCIYFKTLSQVEGF